MRRISDIIAAGPTLSVEFFPPRSEEAERQLTDALADLAGLGPSFASVTYGALGSTRDRTRDLVIGMNADHPFPTMAHLTCVGHTRAEIARLLDDYAAAGVTNILALGGDPPADGRPPDGDFTYAIELVEVVRAHPVRRFYQPDGRFMADAIYETDHGVSEPCEIVDVETEDKTKIPRNTRYSDLLVPIFRAGQLFMKRRASRHRASTCVNSSVARLPGSCS